MIGLPLQRSTFDQIDGLAELAGLDHVLPGGRFDAYLDATGSLHVARGDVEALRGSFPPRPEPAFLAFLEHTRRDRCAALRTAWTRAHDGGDSAMPLVSVVADLLARVADVVPYGLLSKFVPELLRDAVVASGATHIPPAPQPSPGSLLTRSLIRLAAWCRAQTAEAPEDLAGRWPDIDPVVKARIEAFCSTHAGFGPVAWEAPGFDDPRYALRAMDGLGGLTEASETPPVFTDLEPADDRPMDLVGAFHAWQEFTELQIWYLRTAFHRGVVPLLRRLGASAGVAPHRLLFLTRQEIATEWPSDVEIDHRIARYTSDTAYLHGHAIGPDRLVELLRDPA